MKVIHVVWVMALLSNSLAYKTYMKDRNLYMVDSLNYHDFNHHFHNTALLLQRDDDCPDCPEVFDIVSRVAEEFHSINSLPIRIGCIKCDHNEELCTKITLKKLPVLVLKIRSEHVYFDDIFTHSSVFEFIDSHISKKPVKFTEAIFRQAVSKTKKKESVVAIFDGRSEHSLYTLFEDLSKLENRDHFYLCRDPSCYHYFDHHHNLALFVEHHEKKMRITEHTRLHDLHMKFSIFKHPYEVDFETDFNKRVLLNMNPTVILIMNERDERYIEMFEQATQDYHKIILSCTIEINRLSAKGKKLFDKVVDLLNLEHNLYPVITYVRPDTRSMRLEQYRFGAIHETDALKAFITSVLHDKASRHIRYERFHNPNYQDIPILNGHSFLEHVFLQGRESVILVHKGLDSCSTTKKLLSYIVEISKKGEFDQLSFFLVNVKKNDIPVEVQELPAILIFTQDKWTTPLIFDDKKGDLEVLIDFVRDRKKYFEDSDDGDGVVNDEL